MQIVNILDLLDFVAIKSISIPSLLDLIRWSSIALVFGRLTFFHFSVDADGHEQVVKSISSLLTESLKKSIGHFKYIQEVGEDSNKVNLSSLAFDKDTSPKVAILPPVSTQSNDSDGSPKTPPLSTPPSTSGMQLSTHKELDSSLQVIG